MKHLFKVSICIAFLLFIVLIAVLPNMLLTKEGFDQQRATYKVYLINLDKDKQRLKEFQENYNHSDFINIPFKRIPAINGDNVDSDAWVSHHAKEDFQRNITTGKKEKHHELSKGGLGCFMSHYKLAKQLAEEKDPHIQSYIIFEDDSKCRENTKAELDEHMSHLPENWDMFIGFPIRNEGSTINKYIKNPSSFWGLGIYVLSKKGAEKLVKEVENKKIDGQIDSFLSRMNQHGSINIYSSHKNIIDDNSKNLTNIQIPLEPNGKDPFDYYGTPL